MRTYPRNSPQAAARIVALAMLADGHVCRSEIEALERCDAAARLGLSRAALHEVLHELCQDLLAGSELAWGGSRQVDARTLEALLAEVQDAALQHEVLALCREVIGTDGHVAESESTVLAAAQGRWARQTLGEPEPA